MTITTAQWDEVERELSALFGRVELKCDGYAISAAIERVKIGYGGAA